MKRGYPGGGEVRKSSCVGPSYPEENFDNPWNVGIDKVYGNGDDKTILSPTDTIQGMGAIPLHEGSTYDSYWEHGTRASESVKSRNRGSKWTPRGRGEN